MKKINRLLLTTLLTFYFGTSFSQTLDSLNILPNPFSNSTTIYFDIVQSDTITLRVFNPIGQTVRTFYQSTILPSGSYSINLVGDSLADGLYFIRLDIGSTKAITKKAVKSSSTSIVENSRLVNKLIVFPNPTNDQIIIPINGNKTITVTDLNGKIVKSVKTDQQIISLLDLTAGQYFITILTIQNEIITTQIILKSE